MSVIAFPSDFVVATQTWEQQRNDMEFRSIFGAQALETSPPLWTSVVTAAPCYEKDSGSWQAMLMQLRGKTNQLAMPNIGRRTPRGTMRGTMTLNTAAAQGAAALSIVAAGQNAKTLLKGDLLGLGSGATQQVVMVVADAISDGSGIIAITIEPSLRNAHLIAAAVTWNAPAVLFRCQEAPAKWQYGRGNNVSGFVLHLIEDPRA